jgi:uncharacterized protein YutE (UPF0331/DUF86 family)
MHQEYAFNPALDNYTHIDAMILNIERACQAAIDLAQHLVAEHHLGSPQSSAELFILLKKNGPGVRSLKLAFLNRGTAPLF